MSSPGTSYRLIGLSIALLIGIVTGVLSGATLHHRKGSLRIAAEPLRQAQNAENAVLDYQFTLRDALGLSPAVDPRIVIIGMDEAADEVIGEPEALWGSEYARAVAALYEAGAAVVGFDVVFRPQIDKLPLGDPVRDRFEEEFEPFSEVLSTAPGFVMIGILNPHYESEITENGSTDGYHDDARWVSRSHDSLVGWALADDTRISEAAANVGREADKVVRVLSFYFREELRTTLSEEQGTLQERKLRPEAFFAVLAERAARRELRHDADGRVFFGDQEVVTEPRGFLRVNYPQPTQRLNGKPVPQGNYQSAFEIRLFSEVLQGKSLEDLEGKICIIAPEAASYQDFRATPHSRWTGLESLGVEVHAAALNTLLTGRYLRPILPVAAFSICLGLSLLVGLACVFARTPRRALQISILMMLGYLAITVLSFSVAETVLPMLAPVLAAGCSMIGCLIHRHQSVEKDKRFAEKVLGRMVSPPVMHAILAHPECLQLGGSRKHLTVLYSDINNFTPKCERHKPEEVIVMLNSYFEEMVRIIFEHEGNLKQFVGDEIMVLFGAPQPQEDHAARAVDCGLEMMRRLRELREQDPKGDEGGFYDIKIGIHTGEAVVGQVGSMERSEYAAVGDDVNLGARIMGLTKSLGCNLLVSEATCKRASGLIGVEWISRGPQNFKGKSKTMVIYEVRERAIGGGLEQ
ncbi:MAG: adenylate/guanylate cyclase domain-containing protein [Armatimonadetes bacterium]|nr:adenylate/guanylate cyclase domain-containing protein [Armatimonadota bacterium]